MAVPDDDTFESLVDNGKSDSANLDSVVELLVQSTKSPKEALMLMVPEAFHSQPSLKSRPEVRAVNLGTGRSCSLLMCAEIHRFYIPYRGDLLDARAHGAWCVPTMTR